MKRFKIEVAGHTVLVNAASIYAPAIEQTHRYFLSEGKPEIVIDVIAQKKTNTKHEVRLMFAKNMLIISDECSSAFFDCQGHKGTITIDSRDRRWISSLATFLRNVFMLQLVVKDRGLLLHAAAILKEEEAFIFAGPSGAGKSTVAKLSTGKTVLDDEVVAVKEVGNDFFVFPMPSWGTMQTNARENKPYPIRALYKLIKDKKVFLESIRPAEALADIFTVPCLPPELVPWENMTSSFLKLIRRVPYYGLHFLPEESFWTCIENALAIE